MKKVNNKKGISLIVLVITIIVMIILAAAIILSLQSSGIIGRANEAKAKSDVSNAKNVVAIAQGEWQLMTAEEQEKKGSFREYAEDKLKEAGFTVGAGTNSYVVTETGKVIGSGNNAIYEDEKGVVVIIPDGFVVSGASTEDTVEEGLVIYETTTAVTDTNLSIAQTTYNQYVWVPVDNIDSFEAGKWNSSDIMTNFNIYYVSDTNAYSKEEAAEYIALKASVSEYGGFYMARYEAGLPSGVTLQLANYGQKTDGSALTVPVSIKGVQVWADIPWDGSYSYTKYPYGTWNNPGCAKVARNAYATSNSVVSTLIYGSQWDAAIEYISKNNPTFKNTTKDNGWYSTNSEEVVKNAGTDTTTENTTNKFNNIYDMTGNVSEYTMEVYDSPAVNYGRGIRGCNVRVYSGPPTSYEDNYLDYGHPQVGFRVALYLK